MSDKGSDFESGFTELERAREIGEQDYATFIAELRRRLDALKPALSAAEAAAERAAGSVASLDLPAPAPIDTGSQSVPAALPRVEACPWPDGAGVRGLLNGFLRWALRDFLEVLDRRQDAVVELADGGAAAAEDRHRSVSTALEATRAVLLEQRAALQDHRREAADSLQNLHALAEATRNLAVRLAEAVDLLEQGSNHLHGLTDLKNAETLHRATAGPLRRMDVLFDEVARQQEALLAELVGKRAELEALVAGLRDSAES